jgi:hypothetical protein
LMGGVNAWVAVVLAGDFPNPPSRLAEPEVALPNVLPVDALVVAFPNKLGVDAAADEVAVLSELKDRTGCEVGAEAVGVVPNKLLLWPALAPNTLPACCCPVLVGGVFTGVVDCPKLKAGLL